MPEVEERLSQAITVLAHDLVDVASTCLSAIELVSELDVDSRVGSLSDDEYRMPYDMSPADVVDRLAGAMRALHDAEALTATILNRCGVSWAAMSRGSRQAAHRRLAARGDALFEESQELAQANWYLEDLDMYMGFVEGYAARYSAGGLARRIKSTARTLALLRKEPTWWRSKFYYRV